MTLRQVGRYRLDSLLGVGGMGEVYRAYDTQRDRFVALKLLPEALSGDREYINRFQRESNVAARLRDPHVIPIHDFGEIDGQLFIDMRLVDGTDIAGLLETSGRIAPERAVHLIGQAAEALDAAHADHLVHRDIKPSNILVTPSDFVYVVDFGIARSIGGPETPLTKTGVTIGTWHYMAPERFTGRHIDGRADVYSLACVLHECLTGAPPFRDRDLAALMYAQLYYAPPDASSLVEGVPPALDAVIARGMAKDAEDRFPTAGALAAAARAALLAVGPAPHPPELQHPTGPETPAPGRQVAAPAAARSGPGIAAAQPPGPRLGAPGDRAATGASSNGPTQTVAVPKVAAPGATVPPGHTPAWRRLGLPILAVTVAVAVAVVLVLRASPAPKKTVDTASTQSPSSAPRLAMPTVAGTLSVGGSPNYVQVAPDGKFAYITNPGARAITVLNTVNNHVSGTIKIPQGQPQSVSFSPDSQTAYVSLYGSHSASAVVLIDTTSSTETFTVPVDNLTPGPSATSADGRFLYVPNHNVAMNQSSDSVLDVIDLASKKVVDSIPVKANPHWVAVDKKNGRYYVTNHMSTVITVLDARTNAVIKTIEVGETPHSIALSPDSSRLAITSYSGNQVFLVDTATDQEVKTIPVGRNPLDITYSPDGRYLFTANNDDNTVTVIDVATGSVIGAVLTGKSPTSIAVLPNGRQAYVTDENDSEIEIINLPK